MTTTTTSTKVRYNGDDATVTFPTTFKFIANSHVTAILRDTSDAETTWVEDTDYTLTGAGDTDGGVLTAIVTPATGEVLVVKLDVPFTQEKPLPLGGPFPSTQVEEMGDLAAMASSRNNENIERTLRVPDSDSRNDTNLVLPIESIRASKFLAFDASGDPIAAAGTSADLGPVSAFIDTLLVASDEAAALVTLTSGTFVPMNKGGDLNSTSPLVLDTDGNYFDVAGTTGFSQITVAANTGLFMLQFDGVLTMTDGANLDLGGVNITTVAGDRGLFFVTAADTVILLSFKHESRQRIINSGAKIGTTAGWTIQTNDNLGLAASCQASRTAATLVIPVTGLTVGDKITAFSVVGQIESGGNTVTLDANLRKMTAATSNVTDASVGVITQISVTSDTIISSAKIGLTEIVAANETFYILLTATTGVLTDIALQGITITVSEG